MKLKSFKKGIHPYEGKELSKDSAIQIINASATMVFPLSQHIGAPATAVVAKGDRVLKGQLIAEGNGLISSPVHSSVSGTVKAIEKRVVADGSKVDCIVIENDHCDEAVSGFGEDREPDRLSDQEIAEIITSAGIVGLGGAGFPTGVKLTPKNAQEIVIINGAECEPYLTSDYRLMLEKSAEIIKGAEAVLRLLPNAKAVIGIENNKPEAIKAMEAAAASNSKISVCPLKTKYPQGGESQLM